MTHLTRQDGTHALRHYDASVLLDAGESIKALSEYLGRHDPGFTLRTYTHLMPNSTARTQRAIDGPFGEENRTLTTPRRPKTTTGASDRENSGIRLTSQLARPGTWRDRPGRQGAFSHCIDSPDWA